MTRHLRLFMLTLLSVVFGSAWGGIIIFADLGLENSVQYSDPFDGGDFTVTFSGGANDGKYYITGQGIRVYGNGTMTVTAKSGSHLTKVAITFAGDTYRPESADVVDTGSYDPESGVWTGSASSVVFTRPTGLGHWRIQVVEATVESGTAVEKATPTLSFEPSSLTITKGEAFTEPVLSYDGDGQVTYSIDKESVATINASTGKLTIVGIGTANITATAKETANYKRGTASYSLKVEAGETPDEGDPIVFAELGLENAVQYPDPFDGGTFTVTFAGGNNDGKYYNTGQGIRVYGNGTMTVAAKSGKLTKVIVTFDNSNRPESADVVDTGTFDPGTGVWIGQSPTVTFTRPAGTGHWRVQKVAAITIQIIKFEDSKTKTLCLANWDNDGDGELSIDEAASVTSLGTVFKKSSITSFNELRYFTGLTNIGEGAFSGSTVKEITLPKQITSLEKDAFLNCKSLVSLNIPAYVSTIGQNALSGCTAMTSITVDDANTEFCSIDGVLFSKDKTQLVQFPASKTTEYAVPEGTTTIGRDAFYLSNLESITLPATLKELIYDAFGYSKKLSKMELPEGLETIGDYAFDNCTALKKLWIPASVSTIGQRMCNGCKAITDVYSANDKPFGINDNNFNTAVYANATLYVPAGTKEKYAALEGWKNFANFVTSEGFYCKEVKISVGSTANLSVNLYIDGAISYNGYQFDLHLPEGVTLAKKDNVFQYKLSNRYTDDMTASFHDFGGGFYRVMVFSLSNAIITGTDGEAISLTLDVTKDLESGTYKGEMDNIKMSKTDGNSINMPKCSFDIVVSEFALGDVNHDKDINVADVMMAVNYVLTGDVPNFHRENADVNGDGAIDISDVMGIVNLVLFTPSNAPGSQNHGISSIGEIATIDTNNGYSLSLDNSEACTALQMIITLPTSSSLKDVLLNGNPSHQMRFQRLEGSNTQGNQYKLVVWSADGTALYNTDKFLQLQTSGRKGDITISDIQLTNEEFETIVLPDASSTTSIGDIASQSSDISSKESLYNLQGQKVTQHRKGVLIRKNKKVVIK